ncbi:MAG: sugar phosphate nucleotidyltransferase, partial [Candidatus Omnitrophica bacterium]|nr:sugar phosphate nucleotidyltransferase [Candidatus Omnitrophota bacterium]
MEGSFDSLKGVILAGGLGKRLEPLTRVTNKHLLPVWNKPMIYYPLFTLIEAGIKEIMIVTGGNNAGDFLRLLGNGQEFGLKHLHYAYQKGERGIADALSYAEEFAKGSRVVAILGDNIIEKSIKRYVLRFLRQSRGARILIKKVNNPTRFGVVELKNKKIISIEEKPKRPKSNYIVTGIYMYDEMVFEIINGLKPSERGELEITDVNNAYLQEGLLQYDILDGYWRDCGTFDSLLKANNLVANNFYKR